MSNFKGVLQNKKGLSSMNTLPNRRCLITPSTVQGLGLDNN